MNYYQCKYCSRIIPINSSKKWVTSICAKTNRIVRVTLLNEAKVAKQKKAADILARKRIGTRIKELRNRNGMSQKLVSRYFGKTLNWLSMIESGINSISSEDIVTMCMVLKVEPNEIL